MTQAPQTTRAFLLSQAPTSRRQARLGRIYRCWLILRGNYLAMLGLVILIALIFVAILAPVIAPQNPFAQNLSDRLARPSAAHWLGTDNLGRDIASRLIWGSRIDLFFAATVALITPVAGMLIGSISGFAGGWSDQVLMRIVDIFMAFPRLVLALAFVAALGPGIGNAMLALMLTSWAYYTRLARAETLTIRNADYIAAARLQGCGPVRLLFGHIWPLLISTLIVCVALDMAPIILSAASLGFLGLGVQPPTPEWGAMISDGRAFIFDQWWVAAAPGATIFVVSLAFNLLGDGLRDMLDPRKDQQ